jgi:Ca2+-binding EF-hand superfamily protein
MLADATARIPPARSRAGFSFLAFAIALAVATPVHAQVRASSDYLARMDADHDGRVSLVEYQDWLSYGFDAMDADHDGTLSPGEQPGGRGKPLTRQMHRDRLADAFRRQDLNLDGTLSAAELAAPPR